MGRHARRCMFCDADLHGNRSKEHVFPLWLLSHLGVKKSPLLVQMNRKVGTPGPRHPLVPSQFTRTIERSHELGGLLNGRVCTACNSGWMNHLETTARGALVPLMAGTSPARALSGPERFTLARWAAKTAYGLYFSQSGLDIVSATHPRELHDAPERLPAGVVVFASQERRSPGDVAIFGSEGSPRECVTDFAMSADWTVRLAGVGSEGRVHQMREGSYKLSLQLDRLHLMVACLASPACRLSPLTGLHELLHPPDAELRWRDAGQRLIHVTQLRSLEPSHLGHRQFHYGLELDESPP